MLSTSVSHHTCTIVAYRKLPFSSPYCPFSFPTPVSCLSSSLIVSLPVLFSFLFLVMSLFPFCFYFVPCLPACPSVRPFLVRCTALFVASLSGFSMISFAAILHISQGGSPCENLSCSKPGAPNFCCKKS